MTIRKLTTALLASVAMTTSGGSGGGGMLVPHENPPAMAEAIVQICSLADNDWRRLSDSAYATVTGYSWDDAMGRFETALQRAATVLC